MAGALIGKGQKQPRYAPIYIDRTFTGLWTQRSPLHDPSDLVTARFYGGRPDALWDGLNVELSNKLTLVRRPGLSAFSAATYPEVINCCFEFRKVDGSIELLVDTSGHIYRDNQDGTKTTLLTKASGAGQSYFLSVANVCYIGDGVDLVKYTPGNPNGLIWNWTIAAPTNPPTVTEKTVASASQQWVGAGPIGSAGTWYSTMGIMVDPNGNAQQLIVTNGNVYGSQFGTSGVAGPAWNNTPGGSTTDGTATFLNEGLLHDWIAGGYKVYGDDSIFSVTGVIWDAVHNVPYFQIAGGSPGTIHFTGTTRPNFPISSPGLIDNQCDWNTLHPVNAHLPGNTYGVGQYIYEPSAPPATSQTPVYLQKCTTGGTTSGSAGLPTTTWPALGASGFPTTSDGELQWVCLGSATWTVGASYTAWQSATNHAFNCIKDSNGNLQVCIRSGTAGTAAPTWATAYGAQTDETQAGFGGNVLWACVGTDTGWQQTTQHYLPATGFSAPLQVTIYGGPAILDSNNNVEFVINSGVSGTSAPSWAAPGSNTTDGSVTWYDLGVNVGTSLSWSNGYVYAYSFKTRSLTDFYSVASPTLNSSGVFVNVVPTPPGLNAQLPNPPSGSQTGGISTASPVNSALAVSSSSGSINEISGFGSLDPQVDTIVIWRSADGGGSGDMFELTEIPAPTPVNGIARSWTFADFLPDTPSSNGLYPGLNNLISAPIDDVNDPPPAGFLPMAYHFERIWGASGTTAFFSGGPDTLTGNPNEAFSPDDEFPFLSTVTRLVHTPAGLISFLSSDIEIIAGGPSTASFYSTTLVPGIGLLSYNALDIHGGILYFLSSDQQFCSMDPALAVSRAGFAIGDKIAGFNPANAYVTVHESGVDNCVFVADGSTGWYRLNPHQVPQGEAIWSPFAQITGGCKMVQSVETSKGVHQLLIGSASTGQSILKRDLTVNSDNGAAYASWLVMGSLVLAHPGQMAELGFLESDFVKVGSQPTVSFLLNEISGSFISFSTSQFDPPLLYGTTVTPNTLYPNRYYFKQAMAGNAQPPPVYCRHLQIKVDFGANDTVPNEMLNLTIFGAIYAEH